nr:hypothetical protein [Tanacetum cinerariifolium]
MMVLKLGYTGESKPMFYNYLRPLTSLDVRLYALACEEDVHCLATLVKSFKLIEVYIEHGATVLDSYLRAPRFRATLKDITDVPAEVSTQESIAVEVRTEAPIMEDVTQEFSVEDVSSEDEGTDDDDDVDEDFLVDEENKIIEPDVDVHLFGISMDLPFDNIGITNLVSNDVLEGEDVDVINADGFDSDLSNDEGRNYKKRRLTKLRTEMEGVINVSGQWKYSFYTSQKFTSPKEAKDKVYLHSIEIRRNLKLYKKDSVRIRVALG